MDAFSFATGKMDSASDYSRRIIECHMGTRNLEKKYLINQLGEIATAVADFVFSQPSFASLQRADQIYLLKNNIPLYLQYVLARYFTAETGLEQVSRILEAPQAPGSGNPLSLISLRNFQQRANLFPSPETFDLYSLHSRSIGLFFPFPLKVTHLFTRLTVFSLLAK